MGNPCMLHILLMVLLGANNRPGVICTYPTAESTVYYENVTSPKNIALTNLIDTGTMGEKQKQQIIFVCTQILEPIIVIAGIIGNTLNLAVFSHSKSKIRYSTKVYMKALCGTDLIFLVLSLYTLMLDYCLHFNYELLSKILAYSKKYINPIRMGAGGNTAIIVVIISLERFVAICFPMMSERSLLNKYPIVAVLLPLPLNIAFISFSFITFDIISYQDIHRNTTLWRTTPKMFAVEGDFLKVYGPLGEIIYRILPVFMVMICSIIMVIKIHQAARKRMYLTGGQSHVTIPSSGSDMQATRMLVGIAMQFLLCITPGSIVGFFILLHPDWQFMAREHFLVLAMSGITQMLTKINSASNILVYVIASKNFRSTLTHMFRFKSVDNSQTAVSVIPNTENPCNHNDVNMVTFGHHSL